MREELIAVWSGARGDYLNQQLRDALMKPKEEQTDSVKENT